MKVMVLSSFAASNFYFREDMMKAMIKKGHQVVVAAPEPVEDWEEKFSSIGVKYVSIKHLQKTGMNPLQDLKGFFSILNVLKKEKPDKIFTYHAKTIVYGSLAAKVLRIKEIFIFFGGLGSIINNDKFTLVKKILILQYKIAIKHAKKVFLQNEDDIKKLMDLGLVKKEQVVRINGSGVNLEKFSQKPFPHQFTFLFVGRIIKDKGIIEYLEAAKEIKRLYPNVNIQIVGYFDTNPTSISANDLKVYTNKGVVEYLGYHDDVRPFLEKCSVFVLPSYHEGTPKSVLEAMATGRPIITTDVPGCRETVIDGENGFLIPPKNTEALIEKMIWMIENKDLIEKMGHKSRKLCELKFDVNKVNDIILKTMEL